MAKSVSFFAVSKSPTKIFVFFFNCQIFTLLLLKFMQKVLDLQASILISIFFLYFCQTQIDV